MKSHSANEWARAALQAWLDADPRRTKVQFGRELEARIPDSSYPKQKLVRMFQDPGKAKPQKLSIAEVQAIADITGRSIPDLTYRISAPDERNAIQRIAVLLHIRGDYMLAMAGITKAEWEGVVGGTRPLTHGMKLKIADAASVPASYILTGSFEGLSEETIHRIAAAAPQLVAV